jgi:hypothetical protein
MSTAIDWPRIAIDSQRHNQPPSESQTKHYVRCSDTSDFGLAVWNNLALAASVPTASTRPYVACSQGHAFNNLNGWFVNAPPDDDMALAASGTVPATKPYKACSWYAPNFNSWLIDTVPGAIDAGQQSSAATISYNMLLGTGAEWFGPSYAVGSVRAERAATPSEPAKIDEFVEHGAAMRVVAEHFLKGTRDLTPKERKFLTRFYSRVHKSK